MHQVCHILFRRQDYDIVYYYYNDPNFHSRWCIEHGGRLYDEDGYELMQYLDFIWQNYELNYLYDYSASDIYSYYHSSDLHFDHCYHDTGSPPTSDHSNDELFNSGLCIVHCHILASDSD